VSNIADCHKACVTNGGSVVLGVTCFSVDPVKGLSVSGPMRAIPQPGNASPPPGTAPVPLSADITFNPSSTGLFVSLFNATDGPGYIYAYPTVDGQVSQTPVVSSLKDVSTPFSLNFLSSDSRLFVTNPHQALPGAAILDVSPSLQATEAKIVTVPQQVASCWAAYAPDYDAIFVIDAARATITTVNPALGQSVSQFNFTTPAFGSIDSLVDRDFLYTLTVPFNSALTVFVASPQVLVRDITPVKYGQNPKQIQSFDLFNAVGKFPDSFGLAIYPSSR
jgi:hypothetical protein